MKRLFILFTLTCLYISLYAQKCSKEEFQAKKEAFMTKEASLTEEEAAKFFPLYQEQQSKKRELHGKVWKTIKSKGKEATEADYETFINTQNEAEMKACFLDKEYLEKYKTFLSFKKIFQLKRAEEKFHRNMLKIMQQQKKDKKK